MDPEAARRLRVRRKTLAVLGGILAAFLLFTCSFLGLFAGFPPSLWWAHQLNRLEFRRHQDYYQQVVEKISRDMADVKPGGGVFYEATPGREIAGLKRLAPPVASEALERLHGNEVLVEAHRFRNEF